MQSLKKIFTLFFICFLSTSIYAQISIGGQVSVLSAKGDLELSNFGIGTKLDYAYREKISITGGISYFMPKKSPTTVTGSAYTSETLPSNISIDANNVYSWLQISLGMKRYFVGNNEGDFGVYGIFESGYLRANIKSTLNSYDNFKYYPEIEDGAKEALSNFTLNFGLGAEINTKFAYLFADLKANLPANKVNGQMVDIEIPLTTSVNFGLRVPMDGTSGGSSKKYNSRKRKSHSRPNYKKRKRRR